MGEKHKDYLGPGYLGFPFLLFYLVSGFQNLSCQLVGEGIMAEIWLEQDPVFVVEPRFQWQICVCLERSLGQVFLSEPDNTCEREVTEPNPNQALCVLHPDTVNENWSSEFVFLCHAASPFTLIKDMFGVDDYVKTFFFLSTFSSIYLFQV